MLGNSVVVVIVVVVVRTHPRAMPLAMITMRQSTHGFPFLSHMSMGLHLAALWAARAPLKTMTKRQPITMLEQKSLNLAVRHVEFA